MFSWHLKSTSFILALFFAWTFGGIASVANAANVASKNGPTVKQASPKGLSPEALFSKRVKKIEKTINDKAHDHKSRKKLLNEEKKELLTLAKDVRKNFADTEKKLRKAGLSSEIISRHERFVEHFESNLQELQTNLNAYDLAKDGTSQDISVEKMRKHFDRVKPREKKSHFDPNNLPVRAVKPTQKKPRLKKNEFEQEYGIDEASLPPRQYYASLSEQVSMIPGEGGDWNGANPLDLGMPSIEHLSGTVDAPLTPEIQAKAAELGNDPVKIYNWVYNNIEFVPTWGSIQGAQMTMETKQGNAMDTASLLVALLRASGIHARYVIGTVELPIDKIMNWVGGFSDPMAALDFMSSGGVPTTAQVNAGEVVSAKFEHVWVEAWIDYLPSRGAKHKEGDTWIPLDASYKQYTYTEGLDLATAVPFDAQSFVNELTSTAIINEAEGSVTGIDSLLIQQTMIDYQSQLETYISQQDSDVTVDDLLGKKDVVDHDFPFLFGTLPYRIEIRGGAYSLIPSSLRHKLSFSVVRDASDITPLDYSESLPALAGKKITLSYSPATQDDEDVIASYIPTPHPDGTPIQPGELPSSLSAYLIKLKPELRVDGEVVATGSPVNLGASETFTMNFSSLWLPNDQVVNQITAGAYHAVALDLGRISHDQGQRLKSRLEITKSNLEVQDFSDMTKDELIGDLLYTAALMYHAELGLTRTVVARTAKIACATWPSETIFKTDLLVDSVFGLPRSVRAGGFAMDADRLASVSTALDGDQQKKVNFLLQTGMLSSALEHSVPEKLFSAPDNPAEGISAVKALQLANEQGIPIYTLTKINLANVLPQLQIDQQVKADIQDSVNAGKVVTVSGADINFYGWVGCGYIIVDPTTGAGAYMLSGGLNGGVLLVALLLISALLLLSIAFVIGPIAFAIVSILLPFYLAFQAWLATQASQNVRYCVAAVLITLGVLLIPFGKVALSPVKTIFTTLRIYFGIDRIDSGCFGLSGAY